MSPRRCTAFTLVELLVVIAIISILLMLLSPSISRIMEITRRTGCENNHHQIATSLAGYTADYGGYLCYPNWLGPESSGSWLGPGWLYWYRQKLNGGSVWVEADRQKGALFSYHGSHSPYRCPLDTPPWTIGPTHAITSYLMNGAAISYGRDWTSTTVGPLFRITEFYPTDIMFWEAEEAAPYPPFNDGASYPGEGLTRRHKDGATFGCVDGHAEYLTRAQFDAETVRSSQRTRLWCNPATANGQ